MASPSSSQGKVDDVEAGNVDEHDFRKYLKLYRASVAGNWDEAEKLLNQYKDNNDAIIQAPLDCNLDTVLHIAAKTGDAFFAEKVVAKLTNEVAVGIKNRYGLTPLHLAARFGNIKVAGIFVGRNYSLLYERCNKGLFPVHYAACNTRNSKDVFGYFCGVTKDDENGQPNPYAATSGATILVNLIKSKFYEEAMKLVDRYPDLACHRTLDEELREITPLDAIVKYDYPIINKASPCLPDYCISKSILNKKVMHEEAVNLVKCLCNNLKNLNDSQVHSLASSAIFRAARLDIDEVVLNIVEACPSMAYVKEHESGQNILHIAVENRCENVFNIVCRSTALMHDLVEERDNDKNNVMHLAGKLAPPHKLNLVSGAALQMQRELQWFKEVRKIAPSYFSSLTIKDDKTPNMVFTESHKDLKKEGEKWLKETATACTIAAALIVTVVFAAAITVPGGNSDGENSLLPEGINGTIIVPGGGKYGTITFPQGNNNEKNDEGLPIFEKRVAFNIFYISNGASLFTSVFSLLMFLSILTSPDTEEDFLYVFPRRLIIGLFTLLLSIMFMMADFSTTVYLIFCERNLAVRIVLIVLACVPVTLFVILQFRLLVALIWSTYVHGIFTKRGIPQMLF